MTAFNYSTRSSHSLLLIYTKTSLSSVLNRLWHILSFCVRLRITLTYLHMNNKKKYRPHYNVCLKRKIEKKNYVLLTRSNNNSSIRSYGSWNCACNLSWMILSGAKKIYYVNLKLFNFTSDLICRWLLNYCKWQNGGVLQEVYLMC